MSKNTQIQSLKEEWSHNPCWEGVNRPYGTEDVNKLQSYTEGRILLGLSRN